MKKKKAYFRNREQRMPRKFGEMRLDAVLYKKVREVLSEL
jgi:hypothetical protein